MTDCLDDFIFDNLTQAQVHCDVVSQVTGESVRPYICEDGHQHARTETPENLEVVRKLGLRERILIHRTYIRSPKVFGFASQKYNTRSDR